MPSRATEPRPSARTGIVFAFAAYALWGFLPLYFIILAPANAFEIVGWRIVFSLVFCAVLLTATRSWPAFFAIVRTRRLLLAMGLAAVFIYVNWQVYVLGATTGHVVETSLGYFINPIVTVLLGVLVLHERLRWMQWVAVGISTVAVLVVALNYGQFPWIALTLAFSFGLYGLIKKRVGPSVDALSGLTLETAWLLPVAVVQLVVVGSVSGITFGHGSGHTALLIGVGITTAVPLLFFAAASRRLPLVYMGLVQYIAPVLQLLIGVLVLHEAMPPARWIGFGLVWIALVLLTVDVLRASTASRRVAPPEPFPAG